MALGILHIRTGFLLRSCSFTASITRQRDFLCIRQLSYQHTKIKPSKQIRLLQLLRGSQNEPIKVKFTAAYLRPTPPDYVAISYAWGDPTLRHEIECEGKTIGITENVKAILKHLRDPEENKVFWIDALCINQMDLKERGEQVRLMGQIYETANKVTIWLGPEAENSGMLGEFVPKLAVALQASRTLDAVNDKYILRKTGTITSSPEWVALGLLFKRPWFTRMWVVQEYIVSTRREFLCGKTVISAHYLVEAATSIRHLYLGGSVIRSFKFDWDIIAKFLRMAKIGKWRRDGGRQVLPYLSYAFWSSRASDPRDKIFSLLALDDNPLLRMGTDYRETVQEVYTKATKAALEKKQTGILCLAGIGQRRSLPGLPSWVPDFSYPEAPVPPFGLHRYEGWKSPKYLKFDGDRLKIHGVKMDSIASLGTVLTMGPGSDSNLREWLLEVEVLFSRSKYAHKHPKSNARWRSLIADRMFQDEHYTNASDIYGVYFEALTESLRNGTKVQAIDNFSPIMEHSPSSPGTGVMHARRFAAALSQSASERRYCVTAKGDIGLVPGFTDLQDLICFIGGMDIPLVLRPFSEEKNTYQLVGECYIHGIMRSQERSSGAVEEITLV